MQDILTELRGIHRDIRANATTQLLLAELQVAQTTLEHETQRRDNLRAQANGMQQQLTGTQANIPKMEEAADHATDPIQKAQLKNNVENMKNNLAGMLGRVNESAEQLREAENRVRTARMEMESVQSQLHDLVKRLSPAE